MRVTTGLEEPLPDIGRAVTVGAFDGLHMGHQYLIRRTHAEAATRAMESAVLTFEPIPHEFFAPQDGERHRLTTRKERVHLIAQMGVDRLVFAEFDEDFSRLSARDFARHVLRDHLNTRVLVAAENHHMGANAEADVDEIRQLGSEMGFDVVVAPLLSLSGMRVSSTQIRHLLRKGNVSEAAALLGRCYTLAGTVIRGDAIGRTLGYPTANLEPTAHKVIPANGVYAAFASGEGVSCIVNGRQAPCSAAVHIGPRPTFDTSERRIEMFICTDKDLDLVGSHLEMRFVRRLRDVKEFADSEALRKQIQRDVGIVRRFLGTQ